MRDFAGKVAFITGGASGAGLGQAKVFSEAGCKVVIADIRKDHIDEAMAYFKERNAVVHAIQMDVTDRKAYKEAADEVEKIFGGPPQLLIMTAGVNTFGPAEASTYEDYDWVMGVCLGGVINGLVTFVPRMLKSGREGHIAVTSSWGAFMGNSATAPYSAAKAAVNILMESYRIALKPYNIGVSVLCPANIRSNIYKAVEIRPPHLQNTGYNVSEKTIEFLRSIHAEGMDPIELAEWLKRGIENDQLYIIPYENAQQMLEENFQRLKDLCTPEGTQKRDELLEKRFAEMKRNNDPYQTTDSGFAKARKDLNWVKDSTMRYY